MKKFQVGDHVLVMGVIKSVDKDGLCEVSILDPPLPRVSHVFIWSCNLQRTRFRTPDGTRGLLSGKEITKR